MRDWCTTAFEWGFVKAFVALMRMVEHEKPLGGSFIADISVSAHTSTTPATAPYLPNTNTSSSYIRSHSPQVRAWVNIAQVKLSKSQNGRTLMSDGKIYSILYTLKVFSNGMEVELRSQR